MFVDIEGSTELLEAVVDAHYAEALAAFHHLARDTIESHGGSVVEISGDGIFAAFEEGEPALAAAVDLNRRLYEMSLPHGIRLRVRTGLHRGRAVETAGGYVGLDVHRTARIANAGHGGQILLSGPMADSVAAALPRHDLRLETLGRFELKGLSRPELIHQITGPGLPRCFPPLRDGSEVHAV
jgi:class 3 adenylate cyclase